MSERRRKGRVGFREHETDFQRVERRYDELKQQHAAGALGDEELATRLKELMMQDGEGRWWVKSRLTGEWHYHDGERWVKDDPPGYRPAVLELKQDVSDVEPAARAEHQRAEDARERRDQRTEVLGAAAAVISGIAWVACGVLGFFSGLPLGRSLRPPDFLGVLIPENGYLGLLLNTALMFGLGGLIVFHARQRESYGRLGTAGFSVAVAATALWILGHGLFYAAGAREGFLSIGGIIFGSALMGSGLVLLGIATRRALVLPRWYGSLLVVGGVPGLIVFGFTIASLYDCCIFLPVAFIAEMVTLGLVWLALGYVLWPRRHTTQVQPEGGS